MNCYEVQVILRVIASDEENAIKYVKRDILEQETDIDKITILTTEIYS